MADDIGPRTVIDHPLVSFGREICGDLDAALRREWLVTNGLGGYASGTLAGINTRRYHGLLVAALAPPAGRTVLVGGMVEWVSYHGHRYPLSAQEYGDGTIDPQGYKHLHSFTLEGMLPVWVFALGDALLERRVWMEDGANTTHLTYRVLRATGPVDVELTPLVTYRDFHALSHGHGWQPGVEERRQGAAIHAFDGAVPFYMLADRGRFTRPLLDGEEARRVVDAVGRALLTSYGLRSLGPDDPAYHGAYGGDPLQRDGGYHQGPVWAWLSGAYAEAHARVYADREAARALLAPFEHHLRDAGLGTISEILEGNPPHMPRGCIAQAWSVAEVLRVWRALECAHRTMQSGRDLRLRQTLHDVARIPGGPVVVTVSQRGLVCPVRLLRLAQELLQLLPRHRVRVHRVPSPLASGCGWIVEAARPASPGFVSSLHTAL